MAGSEAELYLMIAATGVHVGSDYWRMAQGSDPVADRGGAGWGDFLALPVDPHDGAGVGAGEARAVALSAWVRATVGAARQVRIAGARGERDDDAPQIWSRQCCQRAIS